MSMYELHEVNVQGTSVPAKLRVSPISRAITPEITISSATLSRPFANGELGIDKRALTIMDVCHELNIDFFNRL